MVAAREFLHLAGQLGADSQHGVEQLAAGAFCRWSAEDGLRVLEARVTAERHVAKAEDREQADACFYAASTEYSEHRRIVGTARRFRPNCYRLNRWGAHAGGNETARNRSLPTVFGNAE